ncbi:MAG: ABC transporter ATP-binding protein [Candidatus Caldarchaeum sp.]|nr:ABC transporter ATP-binding protein [Candidatus Caldarchaeum sp.]MCS7137757.1 ABC transporter ATP-binding protein [Candidatus Caldarchaeum sp.]MDW7977510.1 ABC transporter ATP-binding protein [Candidatus Caldarchaeum sp.]MDW8359052.1 ABC transporter ATP-binding protein [Candidatus Caldarchaeum sp.]
MSLLKVEDVFKLFPVRPDIFGRAKKFVHAVDGVSFSVEEGEIFGVIGESGCGKTTLARLIVGLIDYDRGSIKIKGEEVSEVKRLDVERFRRTVQMVPQDPVMAFNPRKTIKHFLTRPLLLHGGLGREEAVSRAHQLLEEVSLTPADFFLDRYPHELSVGQRQRVLIARALSLNPDLLVADEPVSYLDVSVRGQIINLLKEVHKKRRITVLLISHDLSVVYHLCSRIAVMYLGKVVEILDARDLFSKSLHPYTQALVSSFSVGFGISRGERIVLKGEVPSPIEPPSGCRFHPRCSFATDVCRKLEPKPLFSDGRLVACHLYDRL